MAMAGLSSTAGPKAISWLSASSGAFQTAANWSGGNVPGPNSDAVLDAASGASYIVTSSAPQTLTGLQIAANARLELLASMTVSDGTDGGVVAGEISLADGGRLTVSGVFDDTAAIELSAPDRSFRNW